MTDDESVEWHGSFENVHSSSHLTTWSEIQKRNFCYNIDSASYWYMNWGAKKVVCCSRNMCASGEGIDALSFSFSLSLSQRREPWTACQDRNRIPLLSDGFRGGRDNFFFFQSPSYWLRILRRMRPRLCDYTGKKSQRGPSGKTKKRKKEKRTCGTCVI